MRKISIVDWNASHVFNSVVSTLYKNKWDSLVNAGNPTGYLEYQYLKETKGQSTFLIRTKPHGKKMLDETRFFFSGQ